MQKYIRKCKKAPQNADYLEMWERFTWDPGTLMMPAACFWSRYEMRLFLRACVCVRTSLASLPQGRASNRQCSVSFCNTDQRRFLHSAPRMYQARLLTAAFIYIYVHAHWEHRVAISVGFNCLWHIFIFISSICIQFSQGAECTWSKQFVYSSLKEQNVHGLNNLYIVLSRSRMHMV